MTREKIEERIAHLKAHRDRLTEVYQQTDRDIHATEGAIRDCEFWLSQLEPEATTTSNEPTVD